MFKRTGIIENSGKFEATRCGDMRIGLVSPTRDGKDRVFVISMESEEPATHMAMILDDPKEIEEVISTMLVMLHEAWPDFICKPDLYQDFTKAKTI